MTHARADLALIGYGNVAKRFVTLLDEYSGWLARQCGLECRIVGVATRSRGCVYRPQGIQLPDLAGDGWSRCPGQASSSIEVIERLGTSDAALRVVFETTTLDIGGGQPAIDHVMAAVAAGCHVVTANKGPVAFAYAELRDRAAAAGVSFLFEGAVMDGIPIFNLVRETLPAVKITGFRGVINSTTNHILTALERGERFDEALARMQREGIAEADPSLDLDGWDAAAKAAALANVLLDARMTPLDVQRNGIGPDVGRWARETAARGRRLKLVASASRGSRDGAVTALVQPTELEAHDVLAGLEGKANALVLGTDLLGEIAITQRDGNLTHTAYALLSDLVTVRRRQQALAAEPARRTP